MNKKQIKIQFAETFAKCIFKFMHVACILIMLVPIVIAIGLTINHSKNINYDGWSLWCVWPLCLFSSFCLLGLYSLNWLVDDE